MDELDMLDIDLSDACDFLDDIDIDIREEITKELDAACDDELDAIDIRSIANERVKTPEEIYATQVLKQEREFREQRKKMSRYIDESGAAYYGKAHYTWFGALLSILWLLVLWVTFLFAFDYVDKVVCAIGFGVAPIPLLLCKFIDNCIIKYEHNKREEVRFNELNALRKDLGLPEMLNKTVKLRGNHAPCGKLIVIWTVLVCIAAFMVNAKYDFQGKYVFSLVMLVGYLLILTGYQIKWSIRRKNVVLECEDDTEMLAECIQRYRQMGFDRRIHTRGVFRIKFDDLTTELTSELVSKAINIGDRCKYYAIQGLYDKTVKYYFGVRPPRWDMITSNLMRFVSALLILLLGIGVFLKLTTNIAQILTLAVVIAIVGFILVKCTERVVRFIVSGLLFVVCVYLVVTNTDMITNIIEVIVDGIQSIRQG